MLKQNLIIERQNTSTSELDKEFQNVENVILKSFMLLKEYDYQTKIAKTEI